MLTWIHTSRGQPWCWCGESEYGSEEIGVPRIWGDGKGGAGIQCNYREFLRGETEGMHWSLKRVKTSPSCASVHHNNESLLFLPRLHCSSYQKQRVNPSVDVDHRLSGNQIKKKTTTNDQFDLCTVKNSTLSIFTSFKQPAGGGEGEGGRKG